MRDAYDDRSALTRSGNTNVAHDTPRLLNGFFNATRAYGNEHAVGRAIAEHPLVRERVFVATKVWNDEIAAGPEATRGSIVRSLERLGVNAVDLLLLHWPVPGYLDAWRVLEEAYGQGLTRAIGVSNFQVHHLEDLLEHANMAPMVNQVEFHPYLVQPELLRFCRDRHIQHQGWSPLMVGRVDELPVVIEIAESHARTPFQVAIRWALQHGSVTIPKSVNPERIAKNADVSHCEFEVRIAPGADGPPPHYHVGQDETFAVVSGRW